MRLVLCTALLILLSTAFLFSADPNCKLFSLNNRRTLECYNSTPKQIPWTPAGLMTLRMRHTFLGLLKTVENADIVELSLQYCNISSVSATAFAHTTNLQELDLSHNLLTDLYFPPNIKFSIKKLILSHNRFKIIPKLHMLKKLTYLDISHNKIQSISDGSLLLPRLELIYLSNNALRTAHKDDIAAAARIVELDGNPWVCDCHLRTFVDFQRETQIMKSPKCVAPPRMEDAAWHDLSSTDLVCGPEISNPKDQREELIEGEGLKLTCSAWADPTPVVQWIRNENRKAVSKIVGTDRISVTSSHNKRGNVTITLQIGSITLRDEGTYWCQATAGDSTVKKRYDIIVFRKAAEGEVIDFGNLYEGTQKQVTTQESRAATQFIKIPLWMLVVIGIVTLAAVLLIAFCVFLICMRKHFDRKFRRDEPNTANTTTTDRCELIEAPQPEAGKPSNVVSSKVKCSAENSQAILFTKEVNEERPCPSSNGSAKMGNKPDVDENNESYDKKISARLDDWRRKAPLAQYDRDTYVFPLIQTAL